MKNIFLVILVLLTSLFSTTVFSQTEKDEKGLGLPGDGLDLYAVLEIFQKSKTIEDFEKTLNDEKTKINNLDLDNDKKVDFIKVVTQKDGDDFTIALQDPISKSETQDVAVIFVSKEKEDKFSIQIVGDEDLYGKDFVVEPKGSKGSTPNPGYEGGEKVQTDAVSTPSTTTVIVQSPPVVTYMYSPVYVPYYPPYYYGYYPPYYHPWIPIAYGIYWSNHSYCHGGYYGGYHGSVNININNSHHYNNYNNSYRNRSTTVKNYNSNGSYRKNGNVSARPSTRPSRGSSTRPSTSNMASKRPSTRPSTSASTRQSSSNSISRPSSSSNSYGGSSNRSTRPSSGNMNRGGGSSASGAGGGMRSGGGGGMRGGGGRR